MKQDNASVTEPTLLVATSIVDSNVTCNGLSNGDILLLRLLYQCNSGPRTYEDYKINPCTEDCKCWKDAFGCSTNDFVCQGTLKCHANQCIDAADSAVVPPSIFGDDLTVDVDFLVFVGDFASDPWKKRFEGGKTTK